MDVIKYYRELIEKQDSIAAGMTSEQKSLECFTTAHNYLIGYGALRLAIDGRPERSVVDAALKEYQFALLALASGQYRHAFGSLRLFFELMLSAVQFSAHEIDFRMWASDSKDINWSALKDLQTGVFSVNFIRAFNPSFAEYAKQFAAISETVYRECSEFVHGNAGTHAILPAEIAFNGDVHLAWCEKAATMRQAIVFAFAARYLNYVTQNQVGGIESVIVDVIGYLPPVQAVFAKPCEAK